MVHTKNSNKEVFVYYKFYTVTELTFLNKLMLKKQVLQKV